MSTGIEQTLRELTAVAWRDRLSPLVYRLARQLTDPESRRQEKMERIVDYLHSPELLAIWPVGEVIDADDACVLVAALAMSVGIRCRIIAARYGHAWTSWLEYEVGDHWETVDPMRQRPEHNPDEKVTGPVPDEGGV